MSKKLKKAMYANSVSVRNKMTGEVHVWYRGRDGKRHLLLLRSFAKEEIVPKLTDAMLLEFSNLDDLTKAGLIEIL